MRFSDKVGQRLAAGQRTARGIREQEGSGEILVQPSRGETGKPSLGLAARAVLHKVT